MIQYWNEDIIHYNYGGENCCENSEHCSGRCIVERLNHISRLDFVKKAEIHSQLDGNVWLYHAEIVSEHLSRYAQSWVDVHYPYQEEHECCFMMDEDVLLQDVY